MKSSMEETRKFEEMPPQNGLDPDSFVGMFIKPFKEQIIPSSDL